MSRPHITFFGSSLVSSYWNGAATYYRGLLRSLARRGYAITFCEPDAFDRQANRDLAADPPYARVRVYTTPDERDALLAEAFGTSDWVVKCSGVGVWDAELEGALGARAGGDVRTGFWDVDAPATLAALEAEPEHPLHRALPRLDHVFTYGGGPPVVERYRALGARRCSPIYNGLDPSEHYPPDRRGPPRWDALFMGNRLPDREARVDRLFFDVAARLPDRRFALGGLGWESRDLPPNVDHLGHVPTARHNEVNGAARLVLNIHRASMVENGWSPATRMFEAAGAGACQATDAWVGLETFFEPDREILVATDTDAMVRWVRDVDDERAAAIGRAARARALAEHSYDRRAAELDEILGRYREVAA